MAILSEREARAISGAAIGAAVGALIGALFGVGSGALLTLLSARSLEPPPVWRNTNNEAERAIHN